MSINCLHSMLQLRILQIMVMHYHLQITGIIYTPNSLRGDGLTTTIYIFDLSMNNNFSIPISSITGPPIYTDRRGCLAAKTGHDYLYMLGGNGQSSFE